jgi:hypothetical protein
MLAIGWALTPSGESLSNYYENDTAKVSFNYPSGWAVNAGSGNTINEFLSFEDPDVRFYVALQPNYENTAFGLGYVRNAENQSRYFGYRRISGSETNVSGKISTEIHFAYVDIPRDESSPPRIFYVKEVLIPTGNQLLVFSVVAPEVKFPASERVFNAVLKTLKKRS